jgi:chlorophyllide a oxygenase
MAKLQGTWDPYPIAMEFQPPCMVLSTIGLEQPGKLDGSDVDLCPTHLHQLHVCIPSSPGKTRLLYRMALDFAPFLKHVPFIHFLWQHLANKVIQGHNCNVHLIEAEWSMCIFVAVMP